MTCPALCALQSVSAPRSLVSFAVLIRPSLFPLQGVSDPRSPAFFRLLTPSRPSICGILYSPVRECTSLAFFLSFFAVLTYPSLCALQNVSAPRLLVSFAALICLSLCALQAVSDPRSLACFSLS